MKSLAQALREFKEDVVGATVNAPDNYPEWDTGGYPVHRAQLLDGWQTIRSGLKVDHERAAQIDELLQAAIASFDKGERQPAQGLMFKIYHLLEQGRLR